MSMCLCPCVFVCVVWGVHVQSVCTTVPEVTEGQSPCVWLQKECTECLSPLPPGARTKCNTPGRWAGGDHQNHPTALPVGHKQTLNVLGYSLAMRALKLIRDPPCIPLQDRQFLECTVAVLVAVKVVSAGFH